MTSLIRGTLFEIMMASLMILGNHECTQPNSLVVKWHHKDTKDAKNGAALQPNLEMLGLFPFNLVGVKSSIISLHGGEQLSHRLLQRQIFSSTLQER